MYKPLLAAGLRRSFLLVTLCCLDNEGLRKTQRLIHADVVTHWDRVKELYESMRGKVKMDKFEMINPVVQSTDKMAVLSYNLNSYAGETLWKENCTEVYRLEGNIEWKIIHSHWSLTKTRL